MSRSVNKFVIPCVALAALLGPLAATAATAAAATSKLEIVMRTVKYGDLNLGNPKEVEALYKRITVAANSVCEPEDSRTLELRSTVQQCQRQAIADAVKNVNSPALTSLYMVTSHRIELAMAQ